MLPLCLILLGFRNSTRSLHFSFCFSWSKRSSHLALVYPLSYFSCCSWMAEPRGAWARLCPSSLLTEHLGVMCKHWKMVLGWVPYQMYCSYLEKKPLVLPGEPYASSFNHTKSGELLFFLLSPVWAPFPIYNCLFQLFSAWTISVTYPFCCWSIAPNWQCCPLLKLGTKSICMTFLKVMVCTWQEAEELILQLFCSFFSHFVCSQGHCSSNL